MLFFVVDGLRWDDRKRSFHMRFHSLVSKVEDEKGV